MQEKRKFNYMNILLILIFVVGLGILLYPNISNFFNQKNSSKAMSDYDETVATMNEEKRQAITKSANAYNESLIDNSVGRFAEMTEKQKEQYYAELNIDGKGMMCYLKVDKLGLNLPVYHGTTEDVLQHYIGHVEGTSLPVGGIGTHCALSGHRGLPSAVLFTNIDRLEVSDYFTIVVLGEEHVYQVDQILTVLPDDLSPLAIDKEKDYCTLITCTPYGVNTHRLMIRGVRVPDDQIDKEGGGTEGGFNKPTREQIVNMVAGAMTAAFSGILLWLFLFPVVRKREIVIRPWDDNLEKVIASAIKISEDATRANWEVENVTGEADKLANLRRWNDTLEDGDISSRLVIEQTEDNAEENPLRPWNDYRYEDELDENLTEDENKKAREWADDVLEKVDQDWEPLDREGHKNVMKYLDVKNIYERGTVEPPPEDLTEYFEREKEIGKIIVDRSKKK